jgi:hypothetical protein
MEKIAMTIRYIVAGVGAGLVGFGLANAEEIAGLSQHVDAAIGAVTYLSALGYALYNKIRAKV